MNKITKALDRIKKYCYARATLPVLQNVLLELENGALKLTVTNLDATASVVIPYAGKTLCTTTNLKKLMAVIKDMADPIGFEIITEEKVQRKRVYNPETNSSEWQEDTCVISKLVVSDHDTRVTLATIDADEFPPKADKGEHLGEIDLSGVERVWPFACTDRGHRPILECVLFQLHNGCMVAADGFKLAKMMGGVKPVSQDFPETNLLIHADVLSKLPKGATRANLFLGEGAATLEFDTGLTLTVQIPDGKFPDYQQIIPKHFNSQFTVNPKAWLKAVKGVEVFAKDTDGIVRHSVTENTMTVSAKDENGNIIEKTLPAIKTGAYPVFALGYKHLTTALKACASDKIVVKLNMSEQAEVQPSTQPMVFEDGNWMAVIMPLHVENW